MDNEPRHIAEVGARSSFTTIQVGQTVGPIETKMTGDTLLATLIASLEPNAYVDAIRKVGNYSDAYDPASGIQAEHVDAILRVSTKMVLLDWDRTLTMFEGYHSYKDIVTDGTPSRDDYYSDMLKYLFGGVERLALIRGLLTTLIDKGVNVIVVTNNRKCDLSEFLEIVKKLHAGLTRICSGKASIYGGDKGAAVAALLNGGLRKTRKPVKTRKSVMTRKPLMTRKVDRSYRRTQHQLR